MENQGNPKKKNGGKPSKQKAKARDARRAAELKDLKKKAARTGIPLEALKAARRHHVPNTNKRN